MGFVRALGLVALILGGVAPAVGSADTSTASTALTAQLAGGSRPQADKERDAGRKPGEVVTFLGVVPGMTVLDLIAAGGYYTEVMSVAVGESGKVYAQNPDFVLQIREGANDKAMTERLAGGRLPNVVRLDQELGEVGLAPGSVDLAITALNFHDIYNGRGSEAALGFLTRVYQLLRPGGVLGLIDHQGIAGQDNEQLHRIEESKVLEVVRQSGFEIEATSDVLRNPADDHASKVFDPAIRGRTDRFVLKLRKPS
jgi:predicted methyltransferase